MSSTTMDEYLKKCAYGHMVLKLGTELSPYVLSGNPGSFNVIDVRDKASFDAEHIPGAINLTFDGRNNRFTSPNFAMHLDGARPNVFYCSASTCVLSLMAAINCSYIGRTADGSKPSKYLVKTLIGNFEGWKKENFKTESSPLPSKL